MQVFDKNLTYLRQFANEGWNPWDIGISRQGKDGFAFIADHADEWPVTWMCEALEMSASGYYAWA